MTTVNPDFVLLNLEGNDIQTHVCMHVRVLYILLPNTTEHVGP